MYRLSRFSGLLPLLVVFSTGTVSAEQGDDAALVQLRAQHPYTAVFGLPAVAARPVQSGEWQFTLEHANQFMGGRNSTERLLLDGETSELTVRRRQRIGPCMQAELTVPFYQHSTGLFDRAISDWHDFFGMPNASRDSTPYFEINYSYSDTTGERAYVDRAESGIGDIQVSVQRFLACHATADANGSEPIARLGVKLPTGDVGELRGSGEFDAYVDLQTPVFRHGKRWHSGGAIGILFTGRNQQLPPQKTIVPYGSLGLQWKLSRRWRLLGQIDWHTAMYDSQLRELGSLAVSLTTGVRYLGSSNQTLEITLSEDAAIDTVPDIVLRMAWTYRPSVGRN